MPEWIQPVMSRIRSVMMAPGGGRPHPYPSPRARREFRAGERGRSPQLVMSCEPPYPLVRSEFSVQRPSTSPEGELGSRDLFLCARSYTILRASNDSRRSHPMSETPSAEFTLRPYEPERDAARIQEIVAEIWGGGD